MYSTLWCFCLTIPTLLVLWGILQPTLRVSCCIHQSSGNYRDRPGLEDVLPQNGEPSNELGLSLFSGLSLPVNSRWWERQVQRCCLRGHGSRLIGCHFSRLYPARWPLHEPPGVGTTDPIPARERRTQHVAAHEHRALANGFVGWLQRG